MQRYNSRRGGALFIALVVIGIVTATLLAMVELSLNNLRRTNTTETLDQTYFAAKGVSEMVGASMFAAYDNSTQNFEAYLDQRFAWTTVTVGGTDKVLNEFTSTYPSTGVSSIIETKRATATQWRSVKLAGTVIPEVRLYRIKRNSGSTNPYIDMLVIVNAEKDLGFATADAQKTGVSELQRTTDGAATCYTQLLTFSNPPMYTGLDYAILTRNVDCTFCHLQVRSRALVDNTDSKNYGTFERVKIGATDSMSLRTGSANTWIDGTLYQRGTLNVESGSAISVQTFCTCGQVQMAQFTSGLTSINQSSTGAVTYVAPNNATTDSSYNALPANTPPATRQNCYLNYSTDPNYQTDGNLPAAGDFPAPFQYQTGTRLPDASAALTDLVGVNSSIGGGVMVTIPPGTVWSGSALPTTGTAISLTNNGASGSPVQLNNNYILVGTASSPIQLNGKVVINGDVMISGYVKGTGQIWATGNIYVPSDVKYANGTSNGTETFGVAADGTPNLLGMVAGGNIIVGDYLSQVNHWNSGQTNFFNPAGTVEPGKWAASTYTPPYTDLDGANAPHNTSNGLLNTTIASTVTTGVTRKNNFANFVVEELSQFNRDELTKVLTKMPAQQSGMDVTNASVYSISNPNTPDATYIPRYYSMYSANAASKFGSAFTQDIQLFLFGAYNDTGGGSYAGTYWNTSTNNWQPYGDPHTYGWMTPLANIPTTVQATTTKQVLNIHPDWITPTNMLKLIGDAEFDKPDTLPRRLDGLLYTNNALFAIERKKAISYNGTAFSGASAKSGGRMQINGGVIAPDLGVLVTGAGDGGNATDHALIVNYDSRVRSFLPLKSKTTKWSMQRKGTSRRSGVIPQ